jgi:hypothetical protein
VTYFLVDDKLHASLKRLKVSTAAIGLWVCAGSWSRDAGTGGYIPREALRALAPDLSDEQRGALALELVDARVEGIHEHGLWLPLASGWQFNAWEEQYDDAEISDERQRKLSAIRAQAGRRGAQARWSKVDRQDDGNVDGKTVFANGNESPSPHAPLPLRVSGASPSDLTGQDQSADPDEISTQSQPKDLTGSAREDRKPSKTKAGPFRDDAERAVFEHWARVVWPLVHKTGAPRATPKRVSPIRGRLRDGFTVDQLVSVIDAVSRDKFMLGENDRGRPYTEPENFLRNREKVEHWLARGRRGTGAEQRANDQRDRVRLLEERERAAAS